MILTTMWWTTVTSVTSVVAAGLLAAGAGGPAGGADPVGGPGSMGDGTRAVAAPAAGCAGAAGPGARCWPITGPGARGRPAVLRGFDPPAAPWAAGHRGVDLRAGPGAAVRAAAPGVIAFAGAVAGVPVVVLALPGGLRTTYEPVRAELPVGTEVAAGRRVGVLGGPRLPHCRESCLHWGLLRGEVYLDPLSLLPPALRRFGPSRLLPLSGPLPSAAPGARGTPVVPVAPVARVAPVMPAARGRPGR
jgi:murein DD-endopeptidase MepM/ murein hydrolase activator NlpD